VGGSGKIRGKWGKKRKCEIKGKLENVVMYQNGESADLDKKSGRRVSFKVVPRSNKNQKCYFKIQHINMRQILEKYSATFLLSFFLQKCGKPVS